jgi:flagellar biosynthesis regulator FlaF
MAYSMKGIKMSADAKTMIKAMNMTSHKTWSVRIKEHQDTELNQELRTQFILSLQGPHFG